MTLSLFFTMTLSAQTPYEKAMSSKVLLVEKEQSTESLTALANDFRRIADKEKTQWLPYYYAAFSTIQKGRLMMRQGNMSELDAVASEAQKHLDLAMNLQTENAENYILQKMIHGLKMMVNPQERYMTEGPLAENALQKAKALDPLNPRVTLMQAEDTYFTPEQFGGSKTKGLELFQKALDQYAQYKSPSNLHPSWGKPQAEYFLKHKP